MFVPPTAKAGSERVPGPYDPAAAAGPESPCADAALAELPLELVERRIGELAAQISAATCRWLELVAEFERRGGHEQLGFASCASWLAWYCSVDQRSAREHVRVARRLTELPLIRAAFAVGRLSYSKVRALARGAEPAMEEHLLELAQHASAAQLERIMSGYRSATSDQDAERARERRHLSTQWEDDGSLRIRGSLPPEEGALLVKAIELAQTALAAGGPGDQAPDRADALVALAESGIAGGITGAEGGDRHQVVVHVDLADLPDRDRVDGAGRQGEKGGPGAEAGTEEGRSRGARLESGPPIAAETLRRIGCDASLVTMIERDGEPLSVGRKSRSLPPSIARALRSRDRTCRFPGCERTRFVDAHHIHHWADGGETKLDNLVRLCRHHHRLIHEGGFTVERLEPGAGSARLVFRNPHGVVIEESPEPPSGSVEGLLAGLEAEGRQVDPGGVFPLSAGAPMDLHLTVWGLAQRWERCRGEGEPMRGP